MWACTLNPLKLSISMFLINVPLKYNLSYRLFLMVFPYNQHLKGSIASGQRDLWVTLFYGFKMMREQVHYLHLLIYLLRRFHRLVECAEYCSYFAPDNPPQVVNPYNKDTMVWILCMMFYLQPNNIFRELQMMFW